VTGTMGKTRRGGYAWDLERYRVAVDYSRVLLRCSLVTYLTVAPGRLTW